MDGFVDKTLEEAEKEDGAFSEFSGGSKSKNRGSRCRESDDAESDDSDDAEAVEPIFESTLTYDSVYENYMASYGTLENIQRSFGGAANVTEAGMSDTGEL